MPQLKFVPLALCLCRDPVVSLVIATDLSYFDTPYRSQRGSQDLFRCSVPQSDHSVCQKVLHNLVTGHFFQHRTSRPPQSRVQVPRISFNGAVYLTSSPGPISRPQTKVRNPPCQLHTGLTTDHNMSLDTYLSAIR